MELFGPFIFGVFLGGAATWFYFQAKQEKAQGGANVDPSGAGGPRPKPAGTDMEAQAAGGPRPKV